MLKVQVRGAISGVSCPNESLVGTQNSTPVEIQFDTLNCTEQNTANSLNFILIG